ncbi:ribosome biogenesis GTPase Der [Aquisalimonas sp. 2447]|uniref:ribosome biogenesis GTPase Der n=1 Tax=Aquisalimonas sp. 2447 TaxID=2740807 RepID=UPI00143277C5|nr:ribosome biogenesis GTPase Der [Aquisalimonas sp. 2447]QIT55985.1 ribosome biogenesis GTPase Der [Aquisalimonas sp. 2447]
MDPVIALVGRPNVGKSTLFNRLTRSRDALVADFPGLTRDRQYGRAHFGGQPFVVVDTGGMGDDPQGVEAGMHRQALQAIEEADGVVLLVDGKVGVTSADQEIAGLLRRAGKPLTVAVNKTEGVEPGLAGADFHALGLGAPWPIAAAHGHGINRLLEHVFASLPTERLEGSQALVEEAQGTRVAVIGRPNVGKSTLVNRLLGEDRVLVYDAPGTTRDSIAIPFERGSQAYTLIDTAGVRRRSRVNESVEKFSVIKTLTAIDAANVVIMVLDARGRVTEQDAHLVGHAVEAGRGLVIAVNKWDGLAPDEREDVRRTLQVKLGFIEFAEVHFISALHGTGVGLLLDAVDQAHEAGSRDLSTGRLTQILEDAVDRHQPPLVRGRRIKLRYAHQGGRNPPVIVVHGNQAERTPRDYRRYLANTFRKVLELQGTPVRLEFKTTDNPYEGKTNTLSPRQQQRRNRLIRHIKKNSRKKRR